MSYILILMSFQTIYSINYGDTSSARVEAKPVCDWTILNNYHY